MCPARPRSGDSKEDGGRTAARAIGRSGEGHMTAVEIFIPGKPTGKGRPRFGKGQVFTPERTRKKEREIAQLAQIAMIGRQPFLGAVKMTVRAWVPGSRTARPDADNVGKLILDAL